MKPSNIFDVIIIGGGLSGILVGQGMHRMNVSNWKLLEARSILGGRLCNDAKFNEVDMGGAWIWPMHQPYVKQLVKSLPNINTFPQPDDPSSTRIEGGAVRLVHEVAQDLHGNIQLNSPVHKCTKEEKEGEPVVRVETDQETFFARRVVFAAPPRLIHEHVTFEPPLAPAKQQAMADSQTWMAGVTKVALVYNEKFWGRQHSNMGLPSFRGPAFQVYDSSTVDNRINALTFFSLAKTKTTKESDEVLAKEVAEQMAFLWNHLGEKELASKVGLYTSYHVQRWPIEKYLSEDRNPTTINPHPHPVAALSEDDWDGMLLFAGSESDRMSPGVMEGAIGAAKRVLQSLESVITNVNKQCAASADK